jgi:hypothetical protein
MIELLYSNSADNNKLIGSFCWWLTDARRNASLVWLGISVRLSGCGWNATDTGSLNLRLNSKDFQHPNVNHESLAEIISEGNPCNLQIPFAKITLRSGHIFQFFFSAIKWLIMEYWSITTHNWSQPSLNRRSVIKSITIECDETYASSRDCKRPYDWYVTNVFLWHSIQA